MASSEEALQNIVQALEELQEDNTIPKNVKTKLGNIKEILQQQEELSLKLNKALNELDEISDDVNVQSYTRTQLWNIASMLEAIPY
ncbi:UPF0147 family protein [Nanoarchaeota archaeon]